MSVRSENSPRSWEPEGQRHLCSSHNTQRRNELGLYTQLYTHSTVQSVHTVQYYREEKKRKYNSLGIYLIKKHTSRVKDISTYNTYQDLQLEGKFLSSFPYRWEIGKKVQPKKMRCPWCKDNSDDNKIDVKTKTSQKQVIYVASKALKLWSLSYLYKTGLSVQFSAQCQIYIKTTNSTVHCLLIITFLYFR